MKKARYLLEALLLYVLFGFFKILPPETASNVGGSIARTIGPRLASSRKAKRHITLALPEISEEEKTHIVKYMWDNLGRLIAEYPHLEQISIENMHVEDRANVDPLIENKKPAIFIGAHLGNWELNSVKTLTQYNYDIDITYREPNNPWTAALLDKCRTLNGRINAYPKSIESGRHILQSLKNNSFLGILIDQKYNEGVESLFFNQPAMTNPIFVQLAQKFKCPLIPARSVRLDDFKFKLVLYPALKTFEDDGTPRPVIDVIQDAHTLLEEWIKDTPEQWIWLHKRWKKTT